MEVSNFELIAERRLALCLKTLQKKAEEYAGEVDRLENFKRAGVLQDVEPETALVGMWAKHVVSVVDIVEKLEMYMAEPAAELVEEKITDVINYMILLEALFAERREEALDAMAPGIATGSSLRCEHTSFSAS